MRRFSPTVLIVLVGLVLTGCSAGNSPSDIPAPSELTPIATLSATSTPQTSDGPLAALEPSDAKEIAACIITDLTMSREPMPKDSGMGHYYFNLLLTNHGTVDCTLDGYPELWAINSNGNEIGEKSSQTSTGENTVVTLPASGGVAKVFVQATAAGVWDCTTETSDGLRAYMPVTGDRPFRDGIFVKASLNICAEDISLFSVGPFTAA